MYEFWIPYHLFYVVTTLIIYLYQYTDVICVFCLLNFGKILFLMYHI